MKAAAEELIKKGHRTAYLWVFKSNEDAIRFYTKHGGVLKHLAVKAIFGHGVQCRKIEWDDLAIIAMRD
jgi:ribosomal protein S18 acetylase RimI-like enzyme